MPSYLETPATTSTAIISLQATYSRPAPPQRSRRMLSIGGDPAARQAAQILLGNLTPNELVQILSKRMTENQVARILDATSELAALVYSGETTRREAARMLAGNLTPAEVAMILTGEARTLTEWEAATIIMGDEASDKEVTRILDEARLDLLTSVVENETVSGYGPTDRDAVRVDELTGETRFLATSIAIAHFVLIAGRQEVAGGRDVVLRPSIANLTARVAIRRLRYESPLELALVVPPVIFATTSALAALIFSLKRMYAIDLEFRTHREEHRAAFLEAKRRSEEAERARREGHDPEYWPPGTIEAIIVAIQDAARPSVSALKPDEIALIDEDNEAEPEGGGEANRPTA